VEDWDVNCVITNLKVLDPFNVMYTPGIRILFTSSCDVLLNWSYLTHWLSTISSVAHHKGIWIGAETGVLLLYNYCAHCLQSRVPGIGLGLRW